jgi:hypothetical protein
MVMHLGGVEVFVRKERFSSFLGINVQTTLSCVQTWLQVRNLVLLTMSGHAQWELTHFLVLKPKNTFFPILFI